MAYKDKPHAASFGKRYGDDSGWERLVEIDHGTGTLTITIGSNTLHAEPRDAEWIEDALRMVRIATNPLHAQGGSDA